MNHLRRPFYYAGFIASKMHLVFLAVDRLSAHIIRRFHGICLLCDENPEIYDLDFCYGREVWVLHVLTDNFMTALQFARAVQWQGASTVLIIQLNRQLARGEYNV